MFQNKFKIILASLLVTFFATGCSLSGFGPIGGIYSGHKVGVYGTSPFGSKTGKACAHSILGLVSIGDASVEEATRSAGVTKVNNINLESLSILFFYGRLCSIVQGD